ELDQVVATLCSSGRFSRRLNGRQEQRDEHRDDRITTRSSIKVKARALARLRCLRTWPSKSSNTPPKVMAWLLLSLGRDLQQALVSDARGVHHGVDNPRSRGFGVVLHLWAVDRR